MKLLFLLSQEEKIDTYLSEKQAFVPFRYGPYDAEVYDDLAALKELNLITSEGPSAEGGDGEDEEISGDTYDVDTKFQLTQRGESKATEILDTVPKDLIKRITNVKTAFGSMPLVELLHYVYRKYESYTTASDIRRKIMND
jgi:hypothetical protein